MVWFWNLGFFKRERKQICVVNLEKAHEYKQDICLKVNLTGEARPVMLFRLELENPHPARVSRGFFTKSKMKENRDSLDN
jgi:hypothetical protein